MADGYTRMLNGRRNGVVVTQAGPGIENAFGGIAHAYADSVPHPCNPRWHRPRPRGLPARLQRDRPLWWGHEVGGPDQSGRPCARVLASRPHLSAHRTRRPGPARVPGNVAVEELSDASFHYLPVQAYRSAGDPADVRAAAAALLAAKRPVIFAGQGVLWAEASEQLVRLAELLDAPVATTNSGKSAFPENHGLALGAAGDTVTKMARHFSTRPTAFSASAPASRRTSPPRPSRPARS